jgi:NOL1/NOP2/sun family putative RNA methylase
MVLHLDRINPGFDSYHKNILGREYDAFVSALSRPQRKSIRVNTLKTGKEKVVEFLEKNKINFSPVPWYCDGLFVDEKAELDTIEHQLGYYYVQNSSSMIPALALGPEPGESVLDLTAAPGSKTTQLAQLMQNTGVLVANEASHVRVKSLVINIQKCGVSNAVVTRQDGVGYERNKERFDRILLDAPCSDIGTARKNPDVIRRWSPDRVRNLSSLQKKLINSAYMCLKPGGVLVYSTCTTSLEENEGVVEWLLDRNQNVVLEKINLVGLKTRMGLTEKTKETIRLLPQDNDTESYFIAKVRKNA